MVLLLPISNLGPMEVLTELPCHYWDLYCICHLTVEIMSTGSCALLSPGLQLICFLFPSVWGAMIWG